MKTENTKIMKKAGEMIMNKGLSALTIQNLAAELDLKENQLYDRLSKDDDIILMLLLEFEREINEFVKELANKGATPESELKFLFKGLYFLFQQKPYYLALIFDKSLMKRDKSIKKAIVRIKGIAEEYLSAVINNGKKQNNFNTSDSTKYLVDKILSGFRLFMKDEQRLNEMMLELKTIEIIND
jgi:AcrR family transcriptional regulator